MLQPEAVGNPFSVLYAPQKHEPKGWCARRELLHVIPNAKRLFCLLLYHGNHILIFDVCKDHLGCVLADNYLSFGSKIPINKGFQTVS